LRYTHLTVTLDRDLATASFLMQGPHDMPPQTPEAIHAAGASFWPLALARELDDAILHLRLNEGEIGTWVWRSAGDHALVEAADTALAQHADNWLVREITLFFKRTLQRSDVSARSLIALVEPGSCFTGTLLELVLAADRSYMLDGTCAENSFTPVNIRISQINFGPLPMAHTLTRLQ